MTTKHEAELKPCPFCGAEARIVSGGPGNHFVRCMECWASSDDGTSDRVRVVWNRRTPQAVSPEPGGVVALEWKKRRSVDEWTAHSPVGRYEVGQVGRGFVATLRTIDADGQWDDEVLARGLTAPEAKAAAQADFETRIRSAPATGGEVEGEALRYVERLATALYIKHFADVPDWKPLTGNLIGLLTQIDNMTSALRRSTETDKPGVREAALEEAAKVADMFAADHAKSADQFGIDRNRELHNAAKGAAQGVAFAIRALSAPLAAEQPVADRDGSGRYLDWNDPADAIAPLPRSTTGGAK